jgi:hypothetical protein
VPAGASFIWSYQWNKNSPGAFPPIGFSPPCRVARITGGAAMSLFRKGDHHLIPIHPDNAASNDWIVLLEANTIVGAPGGRLRVAKTTQERKIVKRFRSFRRKPFLVIDGYDPRIHTLYFCPQLYKHADDDRLAPLESRLPWYEPTDELPAEPIITGEIVRDFDTLVVDQMPKRPVALVRSAAE